MQRAALRLARLSPSTLSRPSAALTGWVAARYRASISQQAQSSATPPAPSPGVPSPSPYARGVPSPSPSTGDTTVSASPASISSTAAVAVASGMAPRPSRETVAALLAGREARLEEISKLVKGEAEVQAKRQQATLRKQEVCSRPLPFLVVIALAVPELQSTRRGAQAAARECNDAAESHGGQESPTRRPRAPAAATDGARGAVAG